MYKFDSIIINGEPCRVQNGTVRSYVESVMFSMGGPPQYTQTPMKRLDLKWNMLEMPVALSSCIDEALSFEINTIDHKKFYGTVMFIFPKKFITQDCVYVEGSPLVILFHEGD